MAVLYVWTNRRGACGVSRLSPREVREMRYAGRVSPAAAQEYGRLHAPHAARPTPGPGESECAICPLGGVCAAGCPDEGTCPAGWEV